MRLSDLWELTKAMRALRRESREWGHVYRQYLICLLLMLLIGTMRYLTECLMMIFVLYMLYTLLSHPAIANMILSTTWCKWITNILSSYGMVYKSFLT